jgi:hypothetical protein
MQCGYRCCQWREPRSLQLIFSNSGCMDAKVMNSVVQTG